MTNDLDIARLYGQAVNSAADLFATLNDDDWAKPVPCTPEWTVRDVLSHVTGVADDITNGRIEGAASEPWTAAQIERYRQDDTQMLLERWRAQAGPVGALIASIDERRPIFDCHTHEHDLRHALGRPGNRSSEIVELGGTILGSSLTATTSLTIELDDGTSFGDAETTVSGLSHFEVFRSRLGRRTPEQVRAYPWSGSELAIEAAIGSWFEFGPSPHPIEE